MESFPEEIVINILSRLPIQSLVQSKSVCRAWRSLIQDPVFSHKHFCCMLENDPSFVFQSNHPIQSQLYLGDFPSSQNDGNNTMVMKKLPMPPLQRFNLEGSCKGLLLLLDYNRNFEPCIYNPITGNYQELPDIITRHHNSRQFRFGFDSTTKEYKIVEISCTIYTCGSFHPNPNIPLFEASVHILTIGSQTWRNLGTVPFDLMGQEYEAALVNEKHHWVCHPTRNRSTNFIISFDMATEKFQEVPLPDCSSKSWASEGFNQVMVLRGCLSAVCYEDDKEQLEIWVMKEYGVKESWSKEFSIGAYVPKILLELDGPELFQNSRIYLHAKQTRVACLLRSGEMLLEYNGGALAVYDPHCKTFKDLQLTFEGIPTFFKVDVHVPSLNWIDTFINMANARLKSIPKDEEEIKSLSFGSS